MTTMKYLIKFNDGYLAIKTNKRWKEYIDNVVNESYNKFLNQVNTRNHSFEYVIKYVLENLSKKYGFSFKLFTWYEG